MTVPRVKSQLQIPARMIFLGPPGSGKGTLSARLIERFSPDIASLSSSEILRRHIAQRTVLGLRAKSIMDSGFLLDDKIMSSLICDEIALRGWVPKVTTERRSLFDPFLCTSFRNLSLSVRAAFSHSLHQSWILDGFPRTLPQALELDSFLKPRRAPLNLVINISVPPATILARITERYIHEPSGRVYNLSYNPPKVSGRDDVTGDKLIRRTDDEEKIWRGRVERYEEEVGPLEEWADEKGLSVRVSGETSDEIWPQIEREVLRRFGKIGNSDKLSTTDEEKDFAAFLAATSTV